MFRALQLTISFATATTTAFKRSISKLAMTGETPEKVLASLGHDLATIPEIVRKGNYVSSVKTGNTVYLAGHLPVAPFKTGKVGKDLTLEEGYACAQSVCLNMLKTLSNELGGDLSRVNRIVKVNGMVQCGAEFADHPKIINGASDLLVQVFGKDKGSHARTAIGCVSLPCDTPVEIDMVVEIN